MTEQLLTIDGRLSTGIDHNTTLDRILRLRQNEGRGPAFGREESVRNQPMLLFKKRFLDAIRWGKKTQTIRLWKHRRMRSGQRSYIPGAGPIRIQDVQEVRLDELTDADAKPDGFDTADALRRELAALYGPRRIDGWRAYRVVFELMEPVDQET